jgi:hypothetical protein
MAPSCRLRPERGPRRRRDARLRLDGYFDLLRTGSDAQQDLLRVVTGR